MINDVESATPDHTHATHQQRKSANVLLGTSREASEKPFGSTKFTSRTFVRSVNMLRSLALVTLGALNTQWTPPSSCLSTTTLWGSSYFLGFQSTIGLDSECIPNAFATPTESIVTSALIQITTDTNEPTPSTYATITGYTTLTPSATRTALGQLMPASEIISSVGYYSPGVCPSGYTYAASFTAGRPSASESESRYICCPSGFQAPTWTSTSTRTSNGARFIAKVATYDYPLCSQSATTLTNLWSMTPGWPDVRPSSYTLTEAERTYSENYFRVSASGVVVAWNPTDTAVVDFIRSNNVSLPPLPTYGPESKTQSKSLSPSNIAGIVVGSIGVALGLGCYICCACRKRRKTFQPISSHDGGSTEHGVGTSTTYSNVVTTPSSVYHGTNMELSNIFTATTATTTPQPERPARDTDGVFAEAPPRYEEAVSSSKP
ncbi:hypothetical protein P152DRAFT_345454 [Eremomyces bilateralis CBS 781.70]|uniref:Uncharacterized protein n=1 Tax=Eremomyces bilateralis CBS 781.70 TaxID=1392243 RepID=A0A6G1G3N2_9PEZI|nr:uncharacterized protein P152DRAFT_345454 [Eremomyces bilateralis CBS 781.70]KAF1812663.1 hypothetical protein P152DRAFT_345454 [Eremomyces bilateralis CBS 781.70]